MSEDSRVNPGSPALTPAMFLRRPIPERVSRAELAIVQLGSALIETHKAIAELLAALPRHDQERIEQILNSAIHEIDSAFETLAGADPDVSTPAPPGKPIVHG